MDQPLPEALATQTDDMDEISSRDSSIHWKIRGAASKISYRLFSKYGQPKFAAEGDKDFCKFFQETYAEKMLESHLQLMFKRKTGFVGSKTLNFNIKYVSTSIKIERTMAQLKPFMESILYETIVPIMLVTHKDVTLFNDDPIEYIRKQ